MPIRLLAAVVLAGALAACAGGAPRPVTPLGLVPCQLRNSSESVLCGSLEVPENRARPDGRSLSLNIVVVPATGAKTLPPLYHLEGGPGLPATGSVSFWITAGAMHRRHRDIVLVDQRGTGGSNPLRCATNFSSPLEPVLDLDSVRNCRYALNNAGDLSQYTTAATVADLDAVRAALGHEQVDLIGLSYGTRVAQQYLRAYPQRVRAMALLGTLTPAEKLPLSFALNAQAVLVRLAQQCEAAADCRRAVPNAGADIATLKALFAKGPVKTELKSGTPVTLEAGPFWEGVRAQLATTASQRRLPWLLHEAARGRFAPLLAAMPDAPDSAANGLLLSVSCQEDTLYITEADLVPLRATVFGDYRARQQMNACQAWPGSQLPRGVFATSDVPVLMMAGDMDAVTAPQWAEDVAAGMAHARVVTIPYLAHFPDGLSNMECYDQVIAAFFEAGTADGLDFSCIAAMKPPAFEVHGKP